MLFSPTAGEYARRQFYTGKDKTQSAPESCLGLRDFACNPSQTENPAQWIQAGLYRVFAKGQEENLGFLLFFQGGVLEKSRGRDLRKGREGVGRGAERQAGGLGRGLLFGGCFVGGFFFCARLRKECGVHGLRG